MGAAGLPQTEQYCCVMDFEMTDGLYRCVFIGRRVDRPQVCSASAKTLPVVSSNAPISPGRHLPVLGRRRKRVSMYLKRTEEAAYSPVRPPLRARRADNRVAACAGVDNAFARQAAQKFRWSEISARRWRRRPGEHGILIRSLRGAFRREVYCVGRMH
jgi:hypothetical protein